MTDAVRTEPLGRAGVRTPTDRPGQHAMLRGIVHPAMGSSTLPLVVDLGEDTPIHSDDVAGSDIKCGCRQAGLRGS